MMRLGFCIQLTILVYHKFEMDEKTAANLLWPAYLILLIFAPSVIMLILYSMCKKFFICCKGEYKLKIQPLLCKF